MPTITLACKYTYVVAVVYLLIPFSESQVSISGCSEAVKGGFCQLICNTPDFSKTILFRKHSTPISQGACLPSGTCGSAAGYNIGQKSSGSTFETYLNITALNYTKESDLWACYYGISHLSNDLTIIVRTIPSNVTITLSTTDQNPQTISTQAYCVYPNDVVMNIVYQDWGQDIVLDQLTPSYNGPGTVTGCESHEYQVTGSYQLTDSVIADSLAGKTVQFKTRVTVTGLPLYQESSPSDPITYPVQPT